MSDFLLELLSEEIPARMQAKARNDLARLFAECTQEAGLSIGSVEVFSTPRRLALIAREVAEATQASREEVKGPRSSAPPQALEGFLRKTGLTRDQLEERDGVFFAVIERAGRSAAEILEQRIPSIIFNFPWPKSMRWGRGDLRWIRPLHNVLAILGDQPLKIDLRKWADVYVHKDDSSNMQIVPKFSEVTSLPQSLGHPFHHPGCITVGGASDYVEKLGACHVIVDQDEREDLIRKGAAKAAKAAGLTLLEDEGLVVENAGLTEWPVPLVGRFDSDFLDVPREVIVLTMRTNQKYFACTNDAGLLAPAFVCVANIAASDKGAAIAEGNARVLAARLADARFFWEQDLKIPLEEQAKKLDGIVFHEKLGTVADKVERVAKLARWLVEQKIVQADPKQVERAARLAKADLVTGMVGEFPELQGVIGGYLAEAQGAPKAVADAIRDHYKPVGQGDKVPNAPVTVAIALADKLDTLAAFFAANELPTGSRDPFALRRAALGIIALVVTNNLRFSFFDAVWETWDSLAEVLGRAWSEHPIHSEIRFQEFLARSTNDRLAASMAKFLKQHQFTLELESLYQPVRLVNHFVADRLKVQQREAGVRHDLIDGVFALGGEDDLVRLLARVNALQQFVETADGTNLLVAYKRAANILKKENWTGGVLTSAEEQGIPQTGEEDPLVLVDDPILKDAVAEMASGQAGADLPEEKELIAALDEAEPNASAAIDKEDFTAAMAALASLRKPIDDFFDHVTVNDPDSAKRERRLNLLMRFRDAVNRVADFSKIEG